MNGFVDIYTIIFLVLAVVIFLRLRGVLGRRTGSERPPFDPYSRRNAERPATGDKVVSLPRRDDRTAAAPVPTAEEAAAAAEARIRTVAPAGSTLETSLKAVIAADRSFQPEQFIAGAKAAYEMIVTAFAEGDRKTLKQLLSREVYEGFLTAINDREGRGESIEFKFVGIDKAELVDAAIRGSGEQVTIRFVSKLISATRNKDSNVIDGDPAHVGDVTDIWTFSREISSRDPNWKLVATESVE